MVTAALLASVIRKPAVSLEQLGEARAVFDAKVETWSHSIGAQIGAMPFSWMSCAFYPVGDASHRYMLMVSGKVAHLFYEARHGGQYTVDWSLDLQVGKSTSESSGTLARILGQQNCRLPRGIRLTKAQKSSLSARHGFAWYCSDDAPGARFFAAFIDSTGIGHTVRQYIPNPLRIDHPILPIVPEEAEALQEGNFGWSGPKPFTIQPRGKCPDLGQAE
jgi:hypothetical protein